MRFYIIFYTNVMSGHVMSGLTLLCADLRFGLPRISPPLQSPFCHSCSLLLDFLVPPLRLKVQSSALSRSFWTSSCLPSASKSNPPLFLTPFGLPRASPPPQGPFHHAPAPHHSKKADCKAIRQSQSANSNPPVSINQSNPPSANSTK